VAEQAVEALALTTPVDRLLRWTDLLGEAGPGDLVPLRDAVSKAALDVGDPEVVAFAMWWARFDPKAALAWSGTEWRAQSRLVVGAMFRVWANQEPQVAFDQIRSVPEFHHDAVIDATVVGWYESGKPGLVERVMAVPDDALRQRISESLARRVVLVLGGKRATEWLDTIADPGFREAMAMRVMSAAAEQGQGSAIAAWAAPLVTTGEQSPSGIPRRIGTRWILREPEAALAWLASLPPGADRDDGVMESYRDWMRFAPGAAMFWAQNHQVEPWSEPAFSIYARRISKDRPAEGLAILARFTDVDLRNRVSAVIARRWMATDPKAAGEWLATADLPETVRAQIASAAPTAKP
jgi:hypothetical protein